MPRGTRKKDGAICHHAFAGFIWLRVGPQRRHPPMALRPHSQIYVEAELSLDHEDVVRIARCPEIDYLLVGFARPPLEERRGIGTDGITELPTVAIDYLADFFADNVWRRGLGQRLCEQSPLTPGMRVRTVGGYRRCLGEYRRGNDTGFDNGNAHVERLHFLREALAQGL